MRILLIAIVLSLVLTSCHSPSEAVPESPAPYMTNVQLADGIESEEFESYRAVLEILDFQIFMKADHREFEFVVLKSSTGETLAGSSEFAVGPLSLDVQGFPKMSLELRDSYFIVYHLEVPADEYREHSYRRVSDTEYDTLLSSAVQTP